GWQGPLPPSGAWDPQFRGASRTSQALYASGTGERVEVYQATYLAQRADAKLINYFNRVTGERWLILASTPARRVSAMRELHPMTLEVRSRDGQMWLIDYLYSVDGITTSRDWISQILYGALSWTHPVQSGLIAIAAPCLSSCAGASQTLADFW